MTPKPKRLNPDSKAYREKAWALAMQYCPPIYPCRHCSYPVVKGYCCSTCGSDTPRPTERTEAPKRKKAKTS